MYTTDRIRLYTQTQSARGKVHNTNIRMVFTWTYIVPQVISKHIQNLVVTHKYILLEPLKIRRITCTLLGPYTVIKQFWSSQSSLHLLRFKRCSSGCFAG